MAGTRKQAEQLADTLRDRAAEAGVTPAPDAAVAVRLADLRALVKAAKEAGVDAGLVAPFEAC